MKIDIKHAYDKTSVKIAFGVTQTKVKVTVANVVMILTPFQSRLMVGVFITFSDSSSLSLD